MDGRNIDNDVFLIMANARNNPKRQRLKGFYMCTQHGEFIKAVPRSKSPCPYCSQSCELLSRIDYPQEQVVKAAWKERGICEDVRADVRKEKTA